MRGIRGIRGCGTHHRHVRTARRGQDKGHHHRAELLLKARVISTQSTHKDKAKGVRKKSATYERGREAGAATVAIHDSRVVSRKDDEIAGYGIMSRIRKK